MKSKRVLILSASIGTGHTQAARAVEEYINEMPEAVEAEQVDFLSNDVLSIDNIVKETYIKMIDLFPLLYDLLYHFSQGAKKGSTIQTLVSWGLKRRMQRFIREKKPDMLVFTHPFPCGAACLLKRQGHLTIPLMGVITDFDIHQFWVCKELDYYCVPSQQLADRLVYHGIERERVHVTGIPIRRAFFKTNQYGSNAKHSGNTVLIMGGGLGLGSLRQALRRLDRVDAISRFIVVTGHNASLYEELAQMQKKLHHPMALYGYTNEISQLMAESTLLVTKPGALTCTEAVAMQIPMVLFNAIPGQEEANASFWELKGCAKWARDIGNLDDVVTALLAQPLRLQTMSKSCGRWKEDGASNVIQWILSALFRNPAVEQNLFSLTSHRSVELK